MTHLCIVETYKEKIIPSTERLPPCDELGPPEIIAVERIFEQDIEMKQVKRYYRLHSWHYLDPKTITAVYFYDLSLRP